MGRAILYLVLLVQFLGGAVAFYHVDPKVLFSSLSLESGAFIGLFLLIHVLGVLGAILAALRLRWGFLMSIAHQLLMAVGVKIATTFVFLTHDIASFFVFFVSRFGEYSVTYRWAVGTQTIFAQLAANTRGTYIGLNLVALACAGYLWWAMRQTAADADEAEVVEAPTRPQQRPQAQRPRPAHMDGRPQRRAG
jgi:hypothetical protein